MLTDLVMFDIVKKKNLVMFDHSHTHWLSKTIKINETKKSNILVKKN
jgi:hypothetical protein